MQVLGLFNLTLFKGFFNFIGRLNEITAYFK